MRIKSLLIILLIISISGISNAQNNIAQTQEFFVDFTTSTKSMAIQWPVEDPVPSYNPFDSLESVKTQSNQVLNDLNNLSDSNKSSEMIIEYLNRLEYRMGLIEISIKAIEERLQLVDIEN
jgi:hypothetical protein